MLKRIIGVILIVIGVMGIAVSVAGVRIGGQVVDQIGSGIDNTLTLLLGTMENTHETLAVTRATIETSADTLQTVETLTTNLTTTVADTQPLLIHTNEMLTNEVPTSIDGVQETIPTLVAVAGSIDDTLTTLNSFRIDESILGFSFNYSLGIDYAPDQQFDEAIIQIGDSLADIPDSLRGMEGDMDNAIDNMAIIQGDLDALTADLVQIEAEIRAFLPMIDEYMRLTLEINDNIRQTRTTLNSQMETMNSLILFAMVWLALFQLLPLYVGLELARGQEMVKAGSV
jgi:hypothetical protein